MDPITPIATLALVCNITQLVAQAVDAVRCCKELWEQGSLDKHNVLERCTVHIVEANNALDLAIKSQPVAGRAVKIQTLAEDAVDTAKQLKVEVNKLKLSKAQGVTTSENFKRALRTFIKGGSIRRLEEKLQRQERTLKSSLLKDLYIKCGQGDLTRRDEFQKLSQGQQDIITQVLHAQKLLSADLVASIKSSEANITSHLNQQDIQLARSLQLLSTEVPDAVKQSEANVVVRLDAQDAHFHQVTTHHEASAKRRHQDAQDFLHRRLLEALAFPEMHERRNMIENRVVDFGSTYRWIFRPWYRQCDYDFDDTASVRDDNNHEAVEYSGVESDAGSNAAIDVPSPALIADQLDRDKEKELSDELALVHNPSRTIDRTGPLFRTNSERPNLSQWLRRSNDLFWISGKPGSGKSTLMDFVFQHLQKGGLGFGHLQDWAGTSACRLLSFWFFRPATSVLLRSMQGLWRSLCFQIMDLDNHVLETIRHNGDGTAPESLRSCVLAGGSHAQSWTDKELRGWFQYLLEHSASKYCILIDGLDEIENGQDVLLETIAWLASKSANAKVLCSSRPESPFDEMLQKCESLRLQDCNTADIWSDCQTRLHNTRAAHLAGKIVSRAQGVFLWANLIAEDLKLAAARGDEEEDLERRLDECPTEMNELFLHLLQRQDKYYAKNSKPYLRLIEFALTSQSGDLTLLEVLIASQAQAELDSAIFAPRWHDYASILDKRATNFEKNLIPRCAGLVEIYQEWDPHTHKWYLEELDCENLWRMDCLRVVFIHRSVYDFLQDSPKTVSRTLLHPLSDDDVALRLSCASLIKFLINTTEMGPEKVLHFASHITLADWNPKATERLNVLFREFSNRLEDEQSTVETVYKYLSKRRATVTSPQLSQQDNLSFALAAIHKLYPYAYRQTQNLEIDHQVHALAVFHCNAFRRDLEAAEKWTQLFDGPLTPMLTISLKYQNPSPTFISTKCLWEHLAVARVAAVCNDPPASYYPLGNLAGTRQLLGAVKEEEEFDVRALLTGNPFARDILRLVPMPDEWSDEEVQQWPLPLIVFEVQLGLRTARLGQQDQCTFAVPQFLKWKIGGARRFLDLSCTENDELQQAWSSRGRFSGRGRISAIFSWYHDNVAAAWNRCLNLIPPQETVEVLRYHNNDNFGLQSLKDGRMQEIDRTEWYKWRQDLRESHRTETNPVLLEYLKLMDEVEEHELRWTPSSRSHSPI